MDNQEIPFTGSAEVPAAEVRECLQEWNTNPLYRALKETYPESAKIVEDLAREVSIQEALAAGGAWELFARYTQFYVSRRNEHSGCSLKPLVRAAKYLVKNGVLKHMPRFIAAEDRVELYFTKPVYANLLTGRTYTDTPRLRDMSFYELSKCRHMEDALADGYITSSYGD